MVYLAYLELGWPFLTGDWAFACMNVRKRVLLSWIFLNSIYISKEIFGP